MEERNALGFAEKRGACRDGLLNESPRRATRRRRTFALSQDRLIRVQALGTAQNRWEFRPALPPH